MKKCPIWEILKGRCRDGLADTKTYSFWQTRVRADSRLALFARLPNGYSKKMTLLS